MQTRFSLYRNSSIHGVDRIATHICLIFSGLIFLYTVSIINVEQTANAQMVPPPVPSVPPTSTAPVPLNVCTFTDVNEIDYFFLPVTSLASRGAITCDTTFIPYDSASRGAIAKIVAITAGFTEDPGAQIFEDVLPGSTFYDYIQRLANRGFVSGYPCGGSGEPCIPPNNRPYFRPGNFTTRGQVAKIIANSFSFAEPIVAQRFTDVPPGSTFYDFIGRLANRDIISGYPCGGFGEPCIPPSNLPYFRVNSNVLRGQLAKMVYMSAEYARVLFYGHTSPHRVTDNYICPDWNPLTDECNGTSHPASTPGSMTLTTYNGTDYTAVANRLSWDSYAKNYLNIIHPNNSFVAIVFHAFHWNSDTQCTDGTFTDWKVHLPGTDPLEGITQTCNSNPNITNEVRFYLRDPNGIAVDSPQYSVTTHWVKSGSLDKYYAGQITVDNYKVLNDIAVHRDFMTKFCYQFTAIGLCP